MKNNSILKEIKQEFLSEIKNKELIKERDRMKNLSSLLEENNVPTVKQLKQILFFEELS